MFRKIFHQIEFQIRLHTTFSKKETRGALLLLMLMLLSMVLPQYYRFLTLKEEPLTFEEKKTFDSLFHLMADEQQKLPVKKYSYSSGKNITKSTRSPIKKILLDLNKSDSIALLELPGIGPVFAGRVIRFRDKLGGFIHKEQLKKVYGMKPETYDKIVSMIFVSEDFIPKKIKINEVDYPALCEHPFISKKHAYEIVKYRKKNKITGLDFLGDEDVINNLIPYIEF